MKENTSSRVNFLLPTYDRLDVSFQRGEGIYLKDQDGNRYLDALAGIAVNLLGYRHPRLMETGERALDGVHHISNLFEIPSQKALAKKLSEMTFGTRAFFCNSGAEAIEAAIKFSRKYSQRFGTDGRTILTAKNSFHGRTLGALAATGQTKYQDGFGPLPDGFDYVDYNDLNALEDRLDEDVCAVMLEPVQGEGGVVPAGQDYLRGVRELCDEHDCLMVLDEIQSGVGRTGEFLAVQNYGVTPDLVTLAKGLAGGYPIGALLVDRSLQMGLQAGDHASTFGGNPFVSKLAMTVLDTLTKEALIESADERGQQLKDGLCELEEKFRFVDHPRGIGLMVGLPLQNSVEAGEIMHSALEHGLVIGTAGENALRFVPPLIVTEDQIAELLNTLEVVFESFQ